MSFHLLKSNLLLFFLFFLSVDPKSLDATRYGASFSLNYSNYTGPVGERIDGRISAFAQGILVGPNNFLFRSSLYQKKSEAFKRPVFQPSFYLDLAGPQYSSQWRLSTVKSYPVLGLPRETERLDGSLRLARPGLPTFSFDYRRYDNKQDERKREERDYQLYSEYRRGPLLLRYERWRREDRQLDKGTQSIVDGNSFGTQFRMDPMPNLFFYMDYTLYEEEEKVGEAPYFSKDERLTSGFRGTLYEGIESNLTFTGRRSRGRERETLDGNLSLSFWLTPKPDLDIYLSGGERRNFQESEGLQSRYLTFGATSSADFKDLYYTWRYSLRANWPAEGLRSSAQDFHLRLDGGLREGLDFDSYISLSRQSDQQRSFNTVELNGGIRGKPGRKSYLQLRIGRNFESEDMKIPKGKRTTFSFNGSYKMGKTGIYSVDYTGTVGPYPSYSLANSVSLTRGKQILSLTYTRSDNGVYNFLKKGENLVETAGITVRILLRPGAPLSLNYTVTRIQGFLRGSFYGKINWRLK